MENHALDTTHPLGILVVSLAFLGLGPAVYRATRRAGGWTLLLDAAVMLVIAALVLVELLPECVEEAGWTALVAAALGCLGPALAERRAHGGDGGTVRWATPALAAVALGLHAATDGFALAGGHVHGGHGHGLEAAVVLHRLPEGAALWWLLAPRGARFAAGALVGLGASSVIGFAVGRVAHEVVGGPAWLLLQALTGGLLLHVLAHSPALGWVRARVVEWVRAPRAAAAGRAR